MKGKPHFPHPDSLPTADWLRQRLAGPRRLEAVEEDAVPAGLTSAAVLVPVIERPGELTVLFTQRTAHLSDHAGQVSFPGGRSEPTDPSPVFTALRETEEEIGLDPALIEVLGLLPEYRTGTGFRVTPVVGLVTPGFVVRPDPGEVALVFEVPLAFLMDPHHHQRRRVLSDPAGRTFFAMPYRPPGAPAEHFIWGATAAMLRNLYRLLIA